ncbi:MAG: hypothetical protein EU531_10145 [Promethearchaeota archaeon]|nr:MAG: hypothetical protein EU531_10145 [Candidatus Lokiarchaeota archaeon]
MLRQLHVFLKNDLIFTHTYAKAVGDEEVGNIKKILKSFLEIPMPGKTFRLPGSNYQIFHRAKDNLIFVFITDLIDNKEYIENILIQTIDKFQILFPKIDSIDRSGLYSDEFLNFLNKIQHKMHSKIAIMGPYNSGKTHLYNMLKDDEEREIADFAKASSFKINQLQFDLWDFQLPENYHGLWSKFIKGADLILLLFDLSNFNLKIIEHFLQLYNQESNLSKLLIIGNKSDLVNKDEIKLSSNLLKIGEYQTLSLTQTNAKQKIVDLISCSLGLKKELPENFEELIKEAERFEKDGNDVMAIAKYKELIKISNEYQDFYYISKFKDSKDRLIDKLEKEKELRKKQGSKLKFEIPDQIKFQQKVSVKPLPSDGPQELVKPVLPKKGFIEMPLEGTYKKKKVESLTLFTPEDKQAAERKEFSEPEDLSLERKFIPKEDKELHIEKEITSPDFPKRLQSLIEKYGSTLSLKLCEHLLNELKKTLARPLTYEDIETAARIFINQENM